MIKTLGDGILRVPTVKFKGKRRTESYYDLKVHIMVVKIASCAIDFT